MSDFDQWWENHFEYMTRNRLSPAKEAWKYQQLRIEQLQVYKDMVTLRSGQSIIIELMDAKETIEQLEADVQYQKNLVADLAEQREQLERRITSSSPLPQPPEAD